MVCLKTKSSRLSEDEKFMQVCRLTPTSVNIVSTNGCGGLLAQTVSAFMTASYHPPRIAISVQSKSPLIPALAENQSFTVNVLAASHDHIADTFAGRPWPGKERWDFSCGSWSFSEDFSNSDSTIDTENHIQPHTGPDKEKLSKISMEDETDLSSESQVLAPYLDDAVAVLRCRIAYITNLGSHVMYIGVVEDISYQDTLPLVYHNANYCAPKITEPSYFPDFPEAHPNNRFNPKKQN